MPRLLLVTPAELTRDPRARRAAAAAKSLGFGVVGLSGRVSGEQPAPLDGVQIVRTGPQGRTNDQWWTGRSRRREPAPLRELRGLYRLVRLGVRTLGLRRAGRTIGRTDVVHANDLETLPAAYLLSKELHSRLVYDAHELYSEFDPHPPRIAGALLDRIERGLAQRADAVVTVSEPIAQELRRRLGVEPIVVLNAPELDEGTPPTLAPPPPLLAVYQGAFGTGRPLDDLLAALREAPHVRLTLRVNRSSRTLLERELPGDVEDRVDVRDPVPPAEVVSALHGHHVGLLFDRPVTRNAELSAPNKLYEYLMAGLAVVAPDLRGMRWLAEEGLGVLFTAGSAESLADALERLAADPARLASLRLAARAAAVERYNAEAQRGALERAWLGSRSSART
jgi:glycosyltransferase involved in cell wall biosynthesis